MAMILLPLIISSLAFCLNWNSFLKMLLSIEMMMISFFYVLFMMNMGMIQMLYFLILMVMGSILGLALLMVLVRNSGSDSTLSYVYN